MVGFFIFNSVSYIIISYSNFYYKGVDIKTIQAHSGPKAIYLIGGCQCRSLRPFKFMMDSIPQDTAVYLVEYRNCGFNIEKSVQAILEHNQHTEVTFVAISLGYQLAALASKEINNHSTKIFFTYFVLPQWQIF